MSNTQQPPARDPSHLAIETALMETARGRAFLADIARRNRVADTQVLLAAIARLERAGTARAAPDGLATLRCDLADMAAAIARTKAEIAGSLPAASGTEAPEAPATLDGIVRTTERATSDILDATEAIQESAWTMREAGFEAALCDGLDRRATEIYVACEFQDVTAQRVARVVGTLEYLEGRIATLARIWNLRPGGQAAGGPFSPASLALTQSDIDFVMVDQPEETPVHARAPGAPAPSPPPGPPSRRPAHEALASLDALGTRERLQLFT